MGALMNGDRMRVARLGRLLIILTYGTTHLGDKHVALRLAWLYKGTT